MKNLKQFLESINKSGSCWMQDFEPEIINAVKEWLMQKRRDLHKDHQILNQYP